MQVQATYKIKTPGTQPAAAMQAALDSVPLQVTPESGPAYYPDAAGLWTLLGIELVSATTDPPGEDPLWRRTLVFEPTRPTTPEALKAAVRSLYANAIGHLTGALVESLEPEILP